MKLKQHQRNGIITALALAALAALCCFGCGHTVTPLCRHIVLSHHAAAVDAGFEAETWRITNPPGSKWKYHAATRIRKPGGEWEWMTQPKTVWTTGPQPKGQTTGPQPKGQLLHRMQ